MGDTAKPDLKQNIESSTNAISKSTSGVQDKEDIIRENLVETAAKFLKTVKHNYSDAKVKQLFLSKKGLSNQEIQAAFQLAGLPYDNSARETTLSVSTTTPEQPFLSSDVPPYVKYGLNNGSIGPVCHRSHPSVWLRIRDMCNLVFFMFGAAYGLQYLYTRYIRPWLTGTAADQSVEMQLVQLQQSVAASLMQLRTSVDKLQMAIAASEKMQDHGCQAASVTQQLEQTKAEVASLKALLLSRRNFTPTPSSVMNGIPSWQRPSLPQQAAATETAAATTVTTTASVAITTLKAATATATNLDGPPAAAAAAAFTASPVDSEPLAALASPVDSEPLAALASPVDSEPLAALASPVDSEPLAALVSPAFTADRCVGITDATFHASDRTSAYSNKPSGAVEKSEACSIFPSDATDDLDLKLMDTKHNGHDSDTNCSIRCQNNSLVDPCNSNLDVNYSDHDCSDNSVPLIIDKSALETSGDASTAASPISSSVVLSNGASAETRQLQSENRENAVTS